MMVRQGWPIRRTLDGKVFLREGNKNKSGEFYKVRLNDILEGDPGGRSGYMTAAIRSLFCEVALIPVFVAFLLAGFNILIL
jgi:hypothetical protein